MRLRRSHRNPNARTYDSWRPASLNKERQDIGRPDQLKSFLRAAEYLSFSEAAKYLHLTQPTISHHINTLEREFGVELFVRSGHNLKLTEAGRLLLPWAHKLIRQTLKWKR
jgi:DNA-binding transcriptional ArsR family regulator